VLTTDQVKLKVALMCLLLLSACDNSGGTSEDAVNKFVSCYATSGVILKDCFCPHVAASSVDRFTGLLENKLGDSSYEPKNIYPRLDSSLNNVKKVSMWYGGLKIDMKYNKDSWCIHNIFFK
jgi:hypothetical protein